MVVFGSSSLLFHKLATTMICNTTATTTTPITEQNYAVAETQTIFAEYVKKIAAQTGTDGTGVLMHVRKAMDPKDQTVMRANYDTIYSFAILDLAEDATLTMPKTLGGRYQTAWIITEEHYNPFALTCAGCYTLTHENVGTRFCMIDFRTQVNMADPADVAAANKLQDQLDLQQTKRGMYVASNCWDMTDILAMRAKYARVTEEKQIKCEMMFGKKGEVTLENHNCGTAFGWGGFTSDQAVYLTYKPSNPSSADAQKLVLRDVPAGAFWSITVYNAQGNINSETYNINSAFATPNADSSVTIHFGVDVDAPNSMDIFEGWNFTLRMYLPTAGYFSGEWKQPELELLAPSINLPRC